MTYANAPRETYRFTAEQVLAMIERGLLKDADRYELLDGELIEVTAKGPLHRIVASSIHERLLRALPGGFHAQKEECVGGDASSLPEPDVAIVRGQLRDYRDHLPTGKDVVLAVEVSVTTYDDDVKKLAIYARAGVPTVWILDVDRRRLEVHTDNRGDRYATSYERVEGEDIEVPAVGERWSVASMLD